MKHLFVPYEIAVILKEKGFEPDFIMACFDTLNKNELQITTNAHILDNKYKERYITAPLYQQVTDWLREKHKIDICIEPWKDATGKGGREIKIYSHHRLIQSISTPDYYQALTKAIEEALKLI